jgi:putative phosphotransacetylase
MAGPDSQQNTINQDILDRIVKEVYEHLKPGQDGPTAELVDDASRNKGQSPAFPAARIPVNISVRHIHLCQEDLRTLFGVEALSEMRNLYQPGNFAAKEAVSLVGPKMRMLEKVRVLGPLRSATQVELAKTDAIYLGVDAPLRQSGDIAGTAPITLIGPKGLVQIKEGCIRAMRHMHLNPQEADQYGLQEGDQVKIRMGGPSAVTFENVVVRIGEGLRLEVHLDTDEGNVADVHCNQEVEIIKNGQIRGFRA